MTDDVASCSLSARELSARKTELLSVLVRQARAIEEVEAGFRLEFLHGGELAAEVLRMIELERRCCSFLSFRLDFPAEEATFALEVTGPDGTKGFLRELFAEPADH